MEYFIDRLEKVLNEKGISKTELAEKIGIRRPTISDWKKNGAIPSGDICLKIAEYLGVSVEWLVRGKEKKSPFETYTIEEIKRLAKLRDITPEQKESIDILLDGYMMVNQQALKKVSG